MMTLVYRLSKWKDATLGKLKQRSWKAWAAVVLVGYVVLETVRAFVSDAGTLFLVWAFRAMEWLARQPMGVGGLAIVAFLLVLTGTAWLQTRPRRIVQPEPPQFLSEEERRLVQDLRTVWHRYGTLAVNQLRDILRDSSYDLEKRQFWAELLRPITADIDARRTEFESALEPPSNSRIDLVRDRFNDLYAAYIVLMKWVAVLQARDLLTLPSRSRERIQVWRQNHRDMVNRLRDLDEDPAHKGTLKIYLHWIDGPAFRMFLREAEMSADWLALVRESEPQALTLADPSPSAP